MQTNETGLYGLVLYCRRNQKRKKNSKDRGGESCPLPYHMEGNMKEVKIVIDGKEYAKTHPMVKDWRNLVEYQAKNNGKNMMLDEGPLDDAIHLIAEYIDAPEQEIKEKCTLDVIISAFRLIDDNILEAFIGVDTEKNAEGRQRPKK